MNSSLRPWPFRLAFGASLGAAWVFLLVGILALQEAFEMGRLGRVALLVTGAWWISGLVSFGVAGFAWANRPRVVQRSVDGYVYPNPTGRV